MEKKQFIKPPIYYLTLVDWFNPMFVHQTMDDNFWKLVSMGIKDIEGNREDWKSLLSRSMGFNFSKYTDLNNDFFHPRFSMN